MCTVHLLLRKIGMSFTTFAAGQTAEVMAALQLAAMLVVGAMGVSRRLAAANIAASRHASCGSGCRMPRDAAPATAPESAADLAVRRSARTLLTSTSSAARATKITMTPAYRIA